MEKLQKLFELKLHCSLKTIEYYNDIKYNSLLRFIDTEHLKLETLKYEAEEDNSAVIKKKLIHLIDNVPDFLRINKTLPDLTRHFINICKTDYIDTSSINETYVNDLLIAYISVNV